MTPNTAIVKSSFGHHLIEVSVFRISRIAISPMMAYIALVELRNASRTDGVMATRTRCALFCGVRDRSVRTYERFVPSVVEEDHPASSLLVEPDNLLRTSAVCLLFNWATKH
jgi:hypothetical protein